MKKVLILLALVTAATAAFAQSVEKDVELLRSDLRTAKVAFLTDPWGTYIELTENLAPTEN